MATIPHKETLQKSHATPAPAPKRIETLPPGMVMEEVVSDRYAAIDGGFPMPVVVKQTGTETTDSRDVAVSSDCDTGYDRTVHYSVSESRPDSEDIKDESAAEFEEVCSRLDDLLPEIHENPGWDTSSLVRAFKTPRSNPVSESDEWESLEEELGVSVCELAGDIKAELKSSDLPAVEQLQHMLGTAQAETIEVGAAEPVGNGNVTPEPAERPYRNLFSRLRRKQQGLL